MSAVMTESILPSIVPVSPVCAGPSIFPLLPEEVPDDEDVPEDVPEDILVDVPEDVDVPHVEVPIVVVDEP